MNKIRTRFVLSACLLVLAACSTPPPLADISFGAEATDEERALANERFEACLQRQAAKLDDGTSDGSQIALAMRDACSADSAAYLEVVKQGLSRRQREKAENEWPGLMLQRAFSVLRLQREAPGKS